MFSLVFYEISRTINLKRHLNNDTLTSKQRKLDEVINGVLMPLSCEKNSNTSLMVSKKTLNKLHLLGYFTVGASCVHYVKSFIKDAINVWISKTKRQFSFSYWLFFSLKAVLSNLEFILLFLRISNISPTLRVILLKTRVKHK